MDTSFTRAAACIILTVIVTGLLIGAVAAQEVSGEDNEDSEEDEGDTIINIDLEEVVDELEELASEFNDFADGFGDKVKEAVTETIFLPFKNLAESLLQALTAVLTTTPSVSSNPAVEDVHSDLLIVTYLLSTLAFMAAGILYIVGPVLGVSYQEVRMILPRVLIADVFAAFSLPLLQLAVDFTNALNTAFAPAELNSLIQQLAGISVGLVIVWVVQSALILAVVALFILRDIYILFGAAISPILALMWSLPGTKKYADTFIGGWYASLIIAPLDLLVLKMAIALLEGPGSTTLEAVSNWMFGIATFSLLLIVPWQVWNASGSATRKANRIAATAKKRVKTEVRGSSKQGRHNRFESSGESYSNRRRRRPPRYRR